MLRGVGTALLGVVLVAAACVVLGQSHDGARREELEAKGEVLLGNIFSAKKAAALKSFDAGVFKSLLHGTESKLSGAVAAGEQGVAAARKQIKKVEASAAAKPMQTRPLTSAEVEKSIKRDQAALDKTHQELRAAQKTLNKRTQATLQHHKLEKAEEMHLKSRETDADYSRNINWDKQDMHSTEKLTAEIDHLSKQAQVQQKALNAEFGKMLKLEQADMRAHEAGQAAHAQSLHRLAAKQNAQTSSARPTTPNPAAPGSAKLVQGPVPPSCLDLRVVKGVVSVPSHCMKYALVRQVLGEAKERGGVRYAVKN